MVASTLGFSGPQQQHPKVAPHLDVLLRLNPCIGPVDWLVNLKEVVHSGKQVARSSVLDLLSLKVHKYYSQLVSEPQVPGCSSAHAIGFKYISGSGLGVAVASMALKVCEAGSFLSGCDEMAVSERVS